MAEFNKILKSLRTSQGMTQDELSKCLKISRSTIGMYEKGAREPDFETLELIADFFNVDIDYLLGRTSKTTYIPKPINLHNISCTSQEECDLICSYRDLNTENQGKCRAYTQNLLSTQRMEDELIPDAAHAFTPTEEEKKHADSIMKDDKEW